ncbi:hypothetical protein DUI87_07842 [Hirundo rustica rustica]|uniref:Uncharacterized protein n=1 Tax=Hirundo rustica rustica TaxID=333673 RepID=A0A3M0KY08_HIRRU|nr:hypothetical protein DUI87_07842 [Hirundo rustica rustica]
MEFHGGAEICVQSMEDPVLKQVDMSGGRCSMWRKHAGADFLAGAAAQNSCWSSLFLKDCAPWKGASLEQLMKDSEKEGVAGRSCYGLIHIPSSILWCHLRERSTEVGDEGLKLNLGRRGRGKCF